MPMNRDVWNTQTAEEQRYQLYIQLEATIGRLDYIISLDRIRRDKEEELRALNQPKIQPVTTKEAIKEPIEKEEQEIDNEPPDKADGMSMGRGRGRPRKLKNKEEIASGTGQTITLE